MVPLLIILVLFAGVVAVMVLRAWVMARRQARLPLTPTRPCPRCGGDDIDYAMAGLWDGCDRTTGAAAHGVSFYGTCKRCASRVAQWDDAPSYVPTDDEWQREVELKAARGPASGG